MTKEERLEWLKRIEKDIWVSSLESTFADDSKSCAIHSIIEELEQESTTRNCFGCKYSKDNHNADTEECHLCMWENQYTPTTKNNLGVDCISRAEAIDYLCKHCPDDGECFKDCDEIKHLREMPLVTPQESRWIPVTERLPEDGQRVLYVNKDQEIGLGKYLGGIRCGIHGFLSEGVTAWMPLPEPYKGGQEDE